MPEQLFPYQQLADFTRSVFKKIGCSDEHATTATRSLLSADLRGIDSHGVARLSGYVRLWEVQRVNATPEIKVIHETQSTAVVDGDSGLGLVVAPYAMQIAIENGVRVHSLTATHSFGVFRRRRPSTFSCVDSLPGVAKPSSSHITNSTR